MVPAYAETRELLRTAAKEAGLSQAAWLERAVRAHAEQERCLRRQGNIYFIPSDEFERVRRGLPEDFDEAIRDCRAPE